MPPDGFEVLPNVFKLLNKLTFTELAKLSNFSKSYVSQVKRGKCPPSRKLLQALQGYRGRGQRHADLEPYQAIHFFLQSRRKGLSPRTLDFYEGYLKKAVLRLGLTPSPKAVNTFLNSLSCSEGGRHAYFRALRAFYRWLNSPRSGFSFGGRSNPMVWVDAPKVPNLILPSLTVEQVVTLIDTCPNQRDRAIVALFTESGLRLSELTNIIPSDIDWQNRIIRVLGKGRKEAYAPFGELSAQYLKAWLTEFKPNGGNIWGINKWGIEEMLKQLKAKTNLPCSAHTFRRTFACLLRKAGVDTMTIKDLGRWESLEMVQRYTRSVTFEDSLKFYKAPLS